MGVTKSLERLAAEMTETPLVPKQYRELTGREYEFQQKLLRISEGDRLSDDFAAMLQGLPPNDIWQIAQAQQFNQVWKAFIAFVE